MAIPVAGNVLRGKNLLKSEKPWLRTNRLSEVSGTSSASGQNCIVKEIIVISFC